MRFIFTHAWRKFSCGEEDGWEGNGWIESSTKMFSDRGLEGIGGSVSKEKGRRSPEGNCHRDRGEDDGSEGRKFRWRRRNGPHRSPSGADLST